MDGRGLGWSHCFNFARWGWIVMAMDVETTPIVIDNGTKCCKAGFSGDDNPRAILPSAVGVPRQSRGAGGERVGDEPLKRRDLFDVKFPIQRGIIQDWENMEKIWHFAFYNELRIPPDNHPVLLTEPVLNPKANKEKITQIMFETFSVPAMYVSLQPHLSLIAAGRTNGIVLDAGEGVTSVVPICEGIALPHAMIRLHLSGTDLTDYLLRLMTERGYYLETPSEQELAPDIKENLCYVALDYSQEMKNKTPEMEKTYVLPDGRSITLGDERFRCPEAFFQPSMVGQLYPGLPQTICNSIMKCDMASRRELYGNVVVSGGSTLFKGFTERLEKDLLSICPPSVDLQVVAPPERRYSVWVGGSILSSLSSFEEMWISKQDYEEAGAAIVHKKCS